MDKERRGQDRGPNRRPPRIHQDRTSRFGVFERDKQHAMRGEMADHEAEHDKPACEPQPRPPNSEIRRHVTSAAMAYSLVVPRELSPPPQDRSAGAKIPANKTIGGFCSKIRKGEIRATRSVFASAVRCAAVGIAEFVGFRKALGRKASGIGAVAAPIRELLQR